MYLNIAWRLHDQLVKMNASKYAVKATKEVNMCESYSNASLVVCCKLKIML
jgi:hypothetical protein